MMEFRLINVEQQLATLQLIQRRKEMSRQRRMGNEEISVDND